jgi:hypothetical protein
LFVIGNEHVLLIAVTDGVVNIGAIRVAVRAAWGSIAA